MLAKDRVFAIRAGTYTSSDIKEASFNYGYISGDTFKPGGTVAGSAKLTFTSIITSFNKLDKVYPEIGLKVGASFEWVAMGEYFVNDINIDRNRNTTELDLIDGMFKLNQPYISDLTYPAQIRDVIREICVKTGVELETDDLGFRAIQHHIQSKADKKDITFREVLSQAIQLLGFSAFFNRQGKLEVRGLTESRITVTADNYFLHGLTKSEIQYQIAGITCKKDKETLTVGLRTGRSLELENSFMNQNLLDELYYELKDIKYYPFSLDWQGHLKLDVGQWVTLKTNKNETYKVPVLSQSFSFKGGLKSKISADSKAGNDTQYAYKGFLGKRIEQMSTEIEAEVQQQLEYKDKEFDEKINKVKSEINDGIEQSRAEAERYADTIKQQIDGQLAESDRQYQLAQQAQDPGRAG
ncbi:TPA: pblB [Streptococcus suis]